MVIVFLRKTCLSIFIELDVLYKFSPLILLFCAEHQILQVFNVDHVRTSKQLPVPGQVHIGDGVHAVPVLISGPTAHTAAFFITVRISPSARLSVSSMVPLGVKYRSMVCIMYINVQFFLFSRQGLKKTLNWFYLQGIYNGALKQLRKTAQATGLIGFPVGDDGNFRCEIQAGGFDGNEMVVWRRGLVDVIQNL